MSGLHPTGADGIALSPAEEVRAYRKMLLIRRFEEKAGQLFAMGEIQGTCPLCIGQEAAIVGAILAVEKGDQVIAGHRMHGQMLALDIDPEPIFAELMGRTTGLSKGLGGALHMASPAHGFYGGHGRAGLPVGLGSGLAFAMKYRGTANAAFAFIGDGAAERGRVRETLHLAADWCLPLVVVVDNNRALADDAAVPGQFHAGARAAAGLAIPVEEVDGLDVRKVLAATRRAAQIARDGEGPAILDVLTYRYRGHNDVVAMPRSRSGEKQRDDSDPILKTRARLIASGAATEAALKAMEKEIRDEIGRAAAAARAAPRTTALPPEFATTRAEHEGRSSQDAGGAP